MDSAAEHGIHHSRGATKECSILDKLPPEIRTKIYQYVFACNSIKPEADFYGSCFYTRNAGRVDKNRDLRKLSVADFLSLHFVNHQISGEAADSFYSQTKFSSSLFRMELFLKGIHPDHRNNIRYVEFSFSRDMEPMWEILSEMRNLRVASVLIRGGIFSKWDEQFEEHLIELGIMEASHKFHICVVDIPLGKWPVTKWCCSKGKVKARDFCIPCR